MPMVAMAEPVIFWVYLHLAAKEVRFLHQLAAPVLTAVKAVTVTVKAVTLDMMATTEQFTGIAALPNLFCTVAEQAAEMVVRPATRPQKTAEKHMVLLVETLLTTLSKMAHQQAKIQAVAVVVPPM